MRSAFKLGLLLHLLLMLTPSAHTGTVGEQPESLSMHVGESVLVTSEWPISGVMTGSADVADIQALEPGAIVIQGIAPGKTEVYLWSADGIRRMLAVNVTVDLASVHRDLEQLLPGSQLQALSIDRGLLVQGLVADIYQLEQLDGYLKSRNYPATNAARTPDLQQVQVRVRIAEVSREAARTLGVNGYAANSDGFIGSVLGPGGNPINPVSIGMPAGAPAAGGAFEFTQDMLVGSSVTVFGGAPGDVEMFVQALAENRYLRILAEPNLVSKSGEEASFLAGGEFPIPVTQSSGAASGGITVEFKEFGIGLRFRPLVMGDGTIQMDVYAEASNITDIGAVQSEGFQIPAISTRRIQTTVDLASGQTLAMGGLLRENVRSVSARLPAISQLPIIGTLFRSVRYIRGETELVVMVTANLVSPSSEVVGLPLPGEDHVSPTDWELYLGGMLQGAAPQGLSRGAADRMMSMGLGSLQGPGAWAMPGIGTSSQLNGESR